MSIYKSRYLCLFVLCMLRTVCLMMASILFTVNDLKMYKCLAIREPLCSVGLHVMELLELTELQAAILQVEQSVCSERSLHCND